jgi:hypothetical protein
MADRPCWQRVFAGTMIQGLLVLNQPYHVYERRHGALLTMVSIIIALLFNSF